MANIGYSTLTVMPSARGFGAALSRDINPQMHGSGLSAGKVLGAGLLAGAAVVVAGIGAIIKTGVGEAMDASAGTAQLAAGIKSTGNAAGVSVDGINALASSIQKYSGQTDDSIVQSANLLLTFTKIKNTGTDKIFDRATVATANMAAKMGGDASGSAIQLGKALNDPIKGVASLGRMGVQFSDDQKKMIQSLVETGDVAGAQNVILAELETQFGGAAEAAGNSLPGQLAKAKRSFEDVSQAVVEGLLPVVLPGLTSIGDTITTKVIPAITGFVQGFKDGTGPGGDLRDILKKIYDDGIVPLATFINDTALPALGSINSWIYDEGIPAIGDFIGWMKDNIETLKVVATTITVILIPVFADMAAKAVVSGITQVGVWVTTQTAGVTSATSQLISHYVVVGGWVKSAAAAVASGAITVAIWVMLAWESITNAAIYVASLATVAAGWVASAAAATASGITMAAAWVVGLGPIAWVIAAIVLMVGAFVLAYQKIGWFRDYVDAAWQRVYKATMWLKDRWSENFELIKGIVSGAADTIKSNFQTVIDFFREAPGQIGGFFSKIGDTISGVFKKAFNGIAGLWNNTVGKLSFTIPDIPGMPGRGDKISMPKIPTMLDKGGLVTSPTLAIIGERRPEVVIPLEELGKYTGGGGRGQVINIYGVQSIDQIVAELPRLQYRGAA